MSPEDHPTVRAYRLSASARPPAHAARPPLDAASLRERCLAAGADDARFVSIDDPNLGDERAHVLAAFPRTKALIAFAVRMNRENVRAPARSVANAEFHWGRDVADETAHAIVAELERANVPAINPPMAFPMEIERFPDRMWVVSHKTVAVAAGLGRMGIHRNVIHPEYGNFILLGTILLADEISAYGRPLDYNPCLSCKLCVAACPTGAIAPDGYFSFSACYTHNYREFMSGFDDWVGTVVESRDRTQYDAAVTQPETLSMWQSLAFGPNYKAAYCMAVCPAGSDVIGPFLERRGTYLADVVRPLQEKAETIYVTRGSDAIAHVAKRFSRKRTKVVRSGLRVRSIRGFLFGTTLIFQREAAATLRAVYHLRFSGSEALDATVTIDRGRLTVEDGHLGTADLRIDADARSWIDFLNGEAHVLRLLLLRRIRLTGPLRLFRAFGDCFPT